MIFYILFSCSKIVFKDWNSEKKKSKKINKKNLILDIYETYQKILLIKKMGCLIEGIPREQHIRILKEEKERLLKELESRRNSQLQTQRTEFSAQLEKRLKEEREKIQLEFEEKLSTNALSSTDKKLNAYKEYQAIIEKRVEERVSKAIENLSKIGISVRPILFSEGNKN